MKLWPYEGSGGGHRKLQLGTNQPCVLEGISSTSDQLSHGLKDKVIAFRWSKVTVTLYHWSPIRRSQSTSRSLKPSVDPHSWLTGWGCAVCLLSVPHTGSVSSSSWACKVGVHCLIWIWKKVCRKMYTETGNSAFLCCGVVVNRHAEMLTKETLQAARNPRFSCESPEDPLHTSV